MRKPVVFYTVIVILIIGLFCLKYNFYINNPVNPLDSNKISFLIHKGESVREIAADLEDKNLIPSNWAFYIYVRLHDLESGIISGRFLLDKTMTAGKIASVIHDPALAEFVITIQEGLTIKDIDAKLVELGLLKSGQFIQAVKDFNGWEYYTFLDKKVLEKLPLPLEGYLYPDTYYLDPKTFKPHTLIYLALDNFEKKFSEFKATDGQLGKHSLQDVVIMASLIEKEVTAEKDKKIVSGILWKRLESGWILGVDAALLYGANDRVISSEDLNSNSPYNLRKFKGSPPSPICNPSIESMRAAVFPQASDYWYYLTAKNTGEVIYAKTNEEQNQNRQKYL